MGVAVGQRSWAGDAWGLVKTIGVFMQLAGRHNCWREVPSLVPLVQFSACTVTVRLSVMLSLSSSGVSSSKMANGLLVRVCHWWTGCKIQIFEGAVGSCNVVSVWVVVHVVGGAIVRALAYTTLGDRPSVGTLGSGMGGDCGHSTLSDGMSVAMGFDVPRLRIGRKILHSF